MKTNDSLTFDCIVIGGGPAGTTVAALVAQAGHRVLLLEREKFPRFHVGESLMPEAYWTFQRLGVLDKMKQSHHTKKYSVQFVNQTGKESQPFYFFEQYDHESSQTWQIVRSEFDQMLFDNAREKGADCRDQTRVMEVLFEGDRAVGVKAQAADGTVQEFRSRVIVDASGLVAFIANRLKLVQSIPELRKSAIWTYFKGARREAGFDEGATLVLHTSDKQGWFWYIPLANDIVSVGVVGNVDYLLKGRGTPEQIFNEELDNCVAAKSRVAVGERVDDFRVLREFSYASKQPAGNGWVLVGDAFAFLDPIYSSGVFLALKSGELAADCVADALTTGDTSAERLGRWVEPFAAGMHWIRKLVFAFYNDNFSFGQFMKEFPQHKGNLTDLLVGKVFHPSAGEIFKDMQPILDRMQEGEVAETAK